MRETSILFPKKHLDLRKTIKTDVSQESSHFKSVLLYSIYKQNKPQLLLEQNNLLQEWERRYKHTAVLVAFWEFIWSDRVFL